MLKTTLIASLLTFALALSGCKTSGVAVRQECPRPSPAPPSLMKKPTTEAKVRAELFERPQSATRKSAGFRQS